VWGEGFWWGNLKVRVHLEDLGVDEGIILKLILNKYDGVFFGGEGPRSKCYGRTAALRLIVQPCDEYEEKDN
jgi:hypothetical protein